MLSRVALAVLFATAARVLCASEPPNSTSPTFNLSTPALARPFVSNNVITPVAISGPPAHLLALKHGAIDQDFPACTDLNAHPFCLPTNGSDLYDEKTYYVTWNPENFPYDASINVFLSWYNNTRKVVWSFPRVPNLRGGVAFEAKREWLQGQKSRDLTFYAQEYDFKSDKKPPLYTGATVRLVKNPDMIPVESSNSSNTHLALFVGVPVTLTFVALGVFLLSLRRRRGRRVVGIRGMPIRRNNGYNGSRSRRFQRGGSPRNVSHALREWGFLGDLLHRDPETPTPKTRGYSCAPSVESLLRDTRDEGDAFLKGSESEKPKTSRSM
ncbi:uncharacterized protein K452DRAFT_359032 [Aplosporella prunicola CBS 121167]|uniref:Uncharacterized protein n=1 Tax=Aplosporella prunicola CBS 121167 TaxID=1176127 RepID=A0A6A6BAF7_9PEZI|nr:uncharacterized protein K452DRAFT_359032 [Aplosporella prunicola CBS 121167]KAF2141232.1 hypothetical protein K452DRAFT_359032 [Aplosporella prunicola CBS 121167]